MGLEQKDSWVGEKTIGRLRFENKMKAPVNPDSLYKKIERPVIKREGLVVSRKVQKMLPFSSKPKFQRKKIMRNKEEHEMNKILAGLSVICKDKKEREKAASKDKYKKYKEEKDRRELEALRRNK